MRARFGGIDKLLRIITELVGDSEIEQGGQTKISHNANEVMLLSPINNQFAELQELPNQRAHPFQSVRLYARTSQRNCIDVSIIYNRSVKIILTFHLIPNEILYLQIYRCLSLSL